MRWVVDGDQCGNNALRLGAESLPGVCEESNSGGRPQPRRAGTKLWFLLLLRQGGSPPREWQRRQGMNARGTSICKSLHARLALRATTFLYIPNARTVGVTILFINGLRGNEKVADGPGLAHRLQHLSAYGYVHYYN